MSIIILVHTLLIGAYISATESLDDSSWPSGDSAIEMKNIDSIAHDESENGTATSVQLSDVIGVNWIRDREMRVLRQKRDSFISKQDGLDDQLKNEAINYDGRIGLFLFTRYCGPGSRLWRKFFPGERSYGEIDRCCQMHDDCPNFVEKREHYIQYPGLEFRPQYFSRSVGNGGHQLIWLIVIYFLAEFNANAIRTSTNAYRK